MPVNIKYNGASIAEMLQSGIKRLLTKEKYLYDDVTIEYTDPTVPTQSKTVTPTASGFTVTPDEGKLLSSVVVNGDADLVAENIKSGVNIFGVNGSLVPGIAPSGTKVITENGTYDVSAFASASVSVASDSSRSKTWDFNSRTEFRMSSENGTYSFSFGSSALYSTRLPTNDRIWINGGYRGYSTISIFNENAAPSFSSVSGITATGLTYTGSNKTENCIFVPYHLMPGETFSITYTRSGTNRGGYILADKFGTKISQELINASGGGTTTWTYTATQECWLYWEIGKYDANSSFTMSNVSVSIT